MGLEGYQEAFVAIAEQISGALKEEVIANYFYNPGPFHFALTCLIKEVFLCSSNHLVPDNNIRKGLTKDRTDPLGACWRLKRKLLATVVLPGLECRWGNWKMTRVRFLYLHSVRVMAGGSHIASS